MKIGMEIISMINVTTQKHTTVKKVIRLVPVVTFGIAESVNIMSPEKIIIVFGWMLVFPESISTPSFHSLSAFS